MQGPKFLLYGIRGVYNYGCEAIVRGTEILLREQWPNCLVHYASLRLADDQSRLSGAGVQVIPRRHLARWEPANVLRKIAELVNIPWAPLQDGPELFGDYDAILSIGGDLYTTGPTGRYNTHLLRFGKAAIAARKPFVVWGASVGPFCSSRALASFRTHLSKVTLITSREPESTAYLASLGIIDNTVTCADPAFVLPPHPRESTQRPRIAVNLSSLSIGAMCNGYLLKEQAARQASALAQIADACKADLLLVPHVDFSLSPKEDDWAHLKMVQEALPPLVLSRTSILPRGLGFLGTRRALAGCDLVIAARMHCAINAIGTGTPAIFLAYSKKAIGMARTVYGNADFVFPVDAIATPQVRERIVAAFASRHNIRAVIETNLPRLQSEARAATTALRHVLARRNYSSPR